MSRECFTINQEMPEKLMKELGKAKTPLIRDRIKFVIKKGGGTLNVSEILVGMYKTYEEIHKKIYLCGILSAMAKRGELRKTGKKAEYKLNQP